jgi:hypothetical protein
VSPSPARGSGLTLDDLASGPSPKPRSRVQSQIDALEESIKSQISEKEERTKRTGRRIDYAALARGFGKKEK